MSWEDYIAKVYYDPSAAGSFTGVDKLFRYIQQEGKYDISKYKVRNGYKDRNPLVYNDPRDGIIVAIKWSSLALMISGMPTSWI